jgi:ElaB/YqjD/DUF883 family membrane-anchored ribosome-binding protein
VCLVRCSTAEQADTSIPDQIKLLKAFGQQHGMVFVDQVVVSGVTGSVPGARTDIDQIIHRKQSKNDFDVLLVQDVSRLTRAGAEHGMKLKYDLAVAGIEVIFASEGIPTGDHGGIVETVGFYAAQQYVKSLSFATTRGAMSSLERGRVPHCLRPPYGVDRMFVSMDGKPLHIIRNLPDGTQVQLDPNTMAVIQTFGVNEKGKPQHYRMQPNERVVLVPGDPERVAAILHIYGRHLNDGWKGFRIARELDEMGIRSETGSPWSVTSINYILANPVYTGRGIANRFTAAVYHKRSPNAPTKVESSRQTLAHRKRPPQNVRPKSEWMEIEHPLLKDMLGDLRGRAIKDHEQKLSRQAKGHTVAPASKDRHVDSGYILKGILTTKQGGHAMTGRTVGKAKVRYYAVHRGFTVPRKDKLLRRHINADELEHAVMKVVKNVLLSAPDLRTRIVKAIQQQRKVGRTGATDIPKLEAERQKLANQLESMMDLLGSVGRDAMKGKIADVEAKLTDVMARIETTKQYCPAAEKTADAVADEIIADMKSMGKKLGKLRKKALRDLMAAMIGRLEVDMETKAVEIELAVPQVGRFGQISLEDRFARKSFNETNVIFRLELADCRYQRVGRHPCYQCQRRPAA